MLLQNFCLVHNLHFTTPFIHVFSSGENDFKLEKFLSGTPETFEPFYGNDSFHISVVLTWLSMSLVVVLKQA